MTKPINDRALRKAGCKPSNPPAFSSLLPEETAGPPPVNAAETIRAHAADGWSIIGIAYCMGVDPKTFNGWLEREPALQQAIDLGREQEHHVLYNVLYRAATEKGNITAALGILNARHGWRTDQSDSGNRVNVTIALPGAMTLQQFTAISKGPSNE